MRSEIDKLGEELNRAIELAERFAASDMDRPLTEKEMEVSSYLHSMDSSSPEVQAEERVSWEERPTADGKQMRHKLDLKISDVSPEHPLGSAMKIARKNRSGVEGLIVCAGCGAEIDKKLVVCPSCGEFLKRQQG